MGLITNIIESNRRRDYAIAKIQESTQKEIKQLNAYYEEKTKRLQEHHEKFMKIINSPNATEEDIINAFNEYHKEAETI